MCLTIKLELEFIIRQVIDVKLVVEPDHYSVRRTTVKPRSNMDHIDLSDVWLRGGDGMYARAGV